MSGPAGTEMSVPGVVVAAPSSGSGKTTVTTGLLAALAATGRTVAPFKVGPDYIDPGYHALAAGRPGRNLDPVLVGAHRIGPLYAHGARGADLAVVEGVMGLYDGRIPSAGSSDVEPVGDGPADGSTAQVAMLLGAPVLLVVDARGQSQSVAALVRGFATHQPGVRVAGVILNRVGSTRHEAVLRASCESVGVPVLGAIPRSAEVELPSRHLGLTTAAELAGARERVDAMAGLVAESVDLDAVVAAAGGTAGGPEVPPWDPVHELRVAGVDAVGGEGQGPVIAIASGPAFSFSYAEHVELLTTAGARVRTFDPRTDPLPPGTAGLVLPGGFPEEHAVDLAANRRLRTEVAERAEAGMPVYAECAGLLYLARELDGHPMAGVLPLTARFTRGLTLGYRDAVALADSPLYPEGRRVTGHEFHRTAVEVDAGAGRLPPAWGWRDWSGRPRTEGIVTGGVHASYLHVHPAGSPGAVGGFVAAAARWAHAGGPSGEAGERPGAD